jgi:hypothetical protein
MGAENSPGHTQKYETPIAGTSTTMSWFRRDLEMKADRAWVEAKLESLRLSIESSDQRGEDTKVVALRAKEIAGMPHDCNQKDPITRLNNAVEGWSRWWRGILLSFLGVIITVGGSGMYQYFNLSLAVEGTRTTIVKLDEAVGEIETSQQELKKSVESRFQSDDAKLNSYLNDVRQAVTQAIIDSKKGSK